MVRHTRTVQLLIEIDFNNGRMTRVPVTVRRRLHFGLLFVVVGIAVWTGLEPFAPHCVNAQVSLLADNGYDKAAQAERYCSNVTLNQTRNTASSPAST